VRRAAHPLVHAARRGSRARVNNPNTFISRDDVLVVGALVLYSTRLIVGACVWPLLLLARPSVVPSDVTIRILRLFLFETFAKCDKDLGVILWTNLWPWVELVHGQLPDAARKLLKPGFGDAVELPSRAEVTLRLILYLVALAASGTSIKTTSGDAVFVGIA
jgi:hypothetical protein